MKFSFLNFVQPRGTRTHFESRSRHKLKRWAQVFTDNYLTMKAIYLLSFSVLLTHYGFSQSFVTEVKQKIYETVEHTVDSVKSTETKDFKKFKESLANRLILNISRENREILSNEYEVLKYMNDLRDNLNQILNPSNCLLILSTPTLLKEAIRQECTDFKISTLQIIDVKWKEILIELKDLKALETIASTDVDILRYRQDLLSINKTIEKLSISMGISQLNNQINYDSPDDLKRYLQNTLNSAQQLTELNNQLIKFFETINNRLKKYEESLKSYN